MYIAPSLTPAAQSRWERIPESAKLAILAEVWCSKCQTGILIREATGGLHPSGDLILRGLCSVCGHKVCRVIETGETMGPADVYP
jgi:hypothetical protein